METHVLEIVAVFPGYSERLVLSLQLLNFKGFCINAKGGNLIETILVTFICWWVWFAEKRKLWWYRQPIFDDTVNQSKYIHNNVIFVKCPGSDN